MGDLRCAGCRQEQGRGAWVGSKLCWGGLGLWWGNRGFKGGLVDCWGKFGGQRGGNSGGGSGGIWGSRLFCWGKWRVCAVRGGVRTVCPSLIPAPHRVLCPGQQLLAHGPGRLAPLSWWRPAVLASRVVSISGNAKLLRWEALGLQGALLSLFLQPLPLTSLVLGEPESRGRAGLFGWGGSSRECCAGGQDSGASRGCCGVSAAGGTRVGRVWQGVPCCRGSSRGQCWEGLGGGPAGGQWWEFRDFRVPDPST